MEDPAFDVSDTTPEPPIDPVGPAEPTVEVEVEADMAPESDADGTDSAEADVVDLSPPAPPPTAEELAIARAESAEAALTAAIAGTEVAVQAARDAAAIAAVEAAGEIAALKAELAAQAAAHAEATIAAAAVIAADLHALAEAVDVATVSVADRDAQLVNKDVQLGHKDVLIAQLREHLAAADGRYAALRADLAATTPWYVDIQPKGAGPRARKRLIVVAKDMQRATTKAQAHAQGGDVLAITANTEQALLFDV